jgi:hypothetical protein
MFDDPWLRLFHKGTNQSGNNIVRFSVYLTACTQQSCWKVTCDQNDRVNLVDILITVREAISKLSMLDLTRESLVDHEAQFSGKAIHWCEVSVCLIYHSYRSSYSMRRNGSRLLCADIVAAGSVGAATRRFILLF